MSPFRAIMSTVAGLERGDRARMRPSGCRGSTWIFSPSPRTATCHGAAEVNVEADVVGRSPSREP